MEYLHVDIETYCDIDLKKAALYKYASHSSFRILLISYHFKNRLHTIDLLRKNIDDQIQEFLSHLNDPHIVKVAHNAIFEIVCLENFFKLKLKKAQWCCSMVKAAYCGLPLSLDKVSFVLRTATAKDSNGSALIRLFCVPQKNGLSYIETVKRNPDKWQAFIVYNRSDVICEMQVTEKLRHIEIPPFENLMFLLDMKINSYGIKAHVSLCLKIIKQISTEREKLYANMKMLTGVDNPNSLAQLKKWLYTQDDVPGKYSKLDKETIDELIKTTSGDIKKLLVLRSKTNKSSIAKYERVILQADKGNIIRGLLQYYGANRTGRWAGRGIQIHNLARVKHDDIGYIRDLANADMLDLVSSDPLNDYKQLIRTMFIARDGYVFIISDYSSIESRIPAWLCGQLWKQEVFKGDGRIYEATASRMFKIAIDDVTDEQRQRGKIAELSMGYQGGANALIRMGALKGDYPMKVEELDTTKQMWRNENDKIVLSWYRVQDAAIKAVEYPGTVQKVFGGMVQYYIKDKWLVCRLPSGRCLYYYRPRIIEGALHYEGLNQLSKKWMVISTYGGKLFENIVQAIARDILANGIANITKAGYNIAIHVHDEIVSEVKKEQEKKALKEIPAIMESTVKWFPSLVLKCKTFSSDYYKK